MVKIFTETIEILNEIGVSNHLLLIESWAEYLYEECNIIEDFIGNIRTQDIDFLIKNIHKPKNHVDILSEFSKRGYEVDVTGYDIYKLIKEDFEIEFLVQMKGGSYSTSDVPALELKKVEALNHVHMLVTDIVTVEYNGHELTIPNPFNYVLHKMIINNDRKDGKKEKDKRAILNLLLYLDKEEDKHRFLYYFDKILHKKERIKVKSYIVSNNLQFNFDSKMT